MTAKNKAKSTPNGQITKFCVQITQCLNKLQRKFVQK